MAYRQRKNSDTWHWRKDCHWWPKKNYVGRGKKPGSGELCNECKSKSKK